MSASMQVVTSPVLNLFISSNVTSFGSERRFNKDLTVSALKGKLELLTGATPANMKLEVYDKNNKLICVLDDDNAMIGSYQIDDHMRIQVVDSSGRSGEYEDTSQVEKFEISPDAYAQRTDTVRAFKERMKLGRFADLDPEEQKRLDAEKLAKAKAEEAKMSSILVGDRCEVTVLAQPKRRAEVMYVGTTEFQTGCWIGIRYDEPLGKNDGSVKGKRYFDCPAKYGGFVRPNQVDVGNFPEEGMDLDDDDEM